MPVSIYEALGLWPEGEQSPDDKPHLRHTSIPGWFKAEGLIGPLTAIPDEAERERRLRQYGELERYLFAKHVASLPDDERREFEAGTHPSQSHRHRDRAARIAEQLRAELARLGYAAKVEVGFHHMDRIVFWAELPRWPDEVGWPAWPWFFHGFQVKYGLAEQAPPNPPMQRSR